MPFSVSHILNCFLELLKRWHWKETSVKRKVEVAVRPADWSMDCDEFRSIAKGRLDLNFGHHCLDALLHLVCAFENAVGIINQVECITTLFYV